MSLNQPIAAFNARAAQLPPDESARLVRVTLETGESDRFAVKFSAGEDNSCIFTIPELPATYQSGTLSCSISGYCSVTGGVDETLEFTADVEVIADGADTAANFTADVDNVTAEAGRNANTIYSGMLVLDLGTFAPGDSIRIKINRNAGSGADDSPAHFYLTEMIVTESINTLNLTAVDIQTSGLTILNEVPENNKLLYLSAGTLTSSGIDYNAAIPDDLNDLTDVTITTPSGGQILQYNVTDSVWKNEDIAAFNQALNDLSDVTITTVTADDILTWSGTAWVNAAIPSLALDDLSDVAVGGATDQQALIYDSFFGTWKPGNPIGAAVGSDHAIQFATSGALDGDASQFSYVASSSTPAISIANSGGTVVGRLQIVDSSTAGTGTASSSNFCLFANSVTYVTLTTAGVFQFAEATAFSFGTTSGTVLGTGTDNKLAFYGATPVVQQDDPGAPTIATIGDTSAGDESTNIQSSLDSLEDKVNGIRTLLSTYGLI